MKFINPYSNIDFGSITRVKAISHEHITSVSRLKSCYDRGIRYFAAVNYTPAAISYPLEGFSQTVRDWCYIDISDQFPTGGDNRNNLYSPERARQTVPSFYSYHQQGLVITYKNLSNEDVYEKLIKDPTGLDWNDVCADSTAWRTFAKANLGEELVLVDCLYESGFPSFVDKDGNIIQTSSLVQLPNSEHVRIVHDFQSYPSICPHMNILGTLWNEPSHSYRKNNQFTKDYPIYDLKAMNEIVMSQNKQLFAGKIFGTINHTYDLPKIQDVLNRCPMVFKAMELFNQAYKSETLQNFRNAYDTILRHGYRIWGTSVVDWSGTIGVDGEGVKECDFDRGCNVLLIDGYDNLQTNIAKSEAGLDAYISGSFYASGLGNHYIQALDVINDTVSIKVDGNPSSISAITSARKIEGSGNEMSVKISKGETYIRFEVFYYDAQHEDMDFIFTNPIFIEDDNDDKRSSQKLILGII